jgi:hypothetical protein
MSGSGSTALGPFRAPAVSIVGVGLGSLLRLAQDLPQSLWHRLVEHVRAYLAQGLVERVSRIVARPAARGPLASCHQASPARD